MIRSTASGQNTFSNLSSQSTDIFTIDRALELSDEFVAAMQNLEPAETPVEDQCARPTSFGQRDSSSPATPSPTPGFHGASYDKSSSIMVLTCYVKLLELYNMLWEMVSSEQCSSNLDITRPDNHRSVNNGAVNQSIQKAFKRLRYAVLMHISKFINSDHTGAIRPRQSKGSPNYHTSLTARALRNNQVKKRLHSQTKSENSFLGVMISELRGRERRLTTKFMELVKSAEASNVSSSPVPKVSSAGRI